MKKWTSVVASLSLAAVAAGGLTTTLAPAHNGQDGRTDASTPAIVQTDAGSLLGYTDDGVYTFKGIKYGTAARFEQPQPAAAWQGVKPAQAYGAVCPNGSTTPSQWEFMTPSGVNQPQNEDCLYTNVWTKSLDPKKKKPVVFWIHGGGFSSGASNELSYYDGRNIVDSGDVVFVSANHRLNVLGYTDLSAYGPQYKYSGNAGQADLVLALQWVRDNIDQFGGDPNNVTIVGQSGGGSKVFTLLGMPAAKGLFQKAVAMSGGPTGRTQASAQQASASLLASTGLTVDGLKTLPYDKLLAAANAARASGGPVVDGDYYPAVTIADGKFSSISKDVPLIVTNTFAEFNSNIRYMSGGITNANDPLKDVYRPNTSEKRVKELLAQQYGKYADAIAKEFKRAYPGHDLFDALYMADPSSPSGRIAYATAKATQGGAPVFTAVFARNLPIFGGITPFHTGGDLPFWFRNSDKIGYQVAGDESRTQAYENTVSNALVQFAYTGNPSQRGLKWDAFTADRGATMVFDEKSASRNKPDTELLRLIAEAKAAATQ